MTSPALLITRGIVSLLFGIVAILWPAVTLAFLVVIFGAFAFLDGLVNVVLGLLGSASHGRSWPQLVLGVLGILFGMLVVLMPALTMTALIMVVAAWAVARGVFELVAAVQLRRVIPDEWLLAAGGVLSVLFGIFVFAFPALGALAVAWLLGVYALAAGILLIALGIRFRRPLRV
ncbi:MAG TPA: DUF308 domain-containing protein [Vicinamibacterales bacterium]|nr:DUF308 domain-containing protein [Vicinamibacterales bacterium]